MKNIKKNPLDIKEIKLKSTTLFVIYDSHSSIDMQYINVSIAFGIQLRHNDDIHSLGFIF